MRKLKYQELFIGNEDNRGDAIMNDEMRAAYIQSCICIVMALIVGAYLVGYLLRLINGNA